MPKKKHKEIPLAGATKILRAHSTQIEPPGLLELGNLFISRSDQAISLRSDWEPTEEGMYSFGDLIQHSDTEDYVNAAFYVNRAGHTIWFGRVCPFVWDGSTFGLLSSIYNEGTITTDGSEKIVTGTGSSWHQKVWPGCLIREKGTTNDLYTIKEVVNDERLNTYNAMPALTDAEYEILRVHPRFRAEWPVRMESLGGYLVYGVADMNQPIDEKYLSGPWFSNIGRPNLGVWVEAEPEVDDTAIGIGGLSFMHRYINTRFTTYTTYPEVTLSPMLVAGAEGLCFRKDWLIDSYPRWYFDQVAAQSPPVHVSLEIATQINRIQGNVAMTADGKVIDIAIVRGTPVFAPRARFGGIEYSVVWLASGGEAYTPEGAVFDKVRSNNVGKGIFGCLNATTGFYGEGGGYWNISDLGIVTSYTTGVTVTLRDAVAHYGLISPYTTNAVLVGDNDGTEAVAVSYNTATLTGTFVQGTTGLTDDDLNSVSFSWNLRRYVAVGTSGKVITSDDEGATWTERTIGTTLELKRVCHDPAGYCCVAVGGDSISGGVAFCSLDGETWVEITHDSDDPFVDVVYCDEDGYFYFCTNGHAVYRWHRSVYWSPEPTGQGTISGYRSDIVYAIVWDGSNFIAVGNKIWTSPTGSIWTERESNPDEYLICVDYDRNSGILIAGGLDGISYRSTDGGVTWTKVVIDSGGGTVISIGSVASASYAGRLFALTMDGKLYYSTTGGASWTIDATFDPGDNICLAMDVTAHSSVGANMQVTVSTKDGTIWANDIWINFGWSENGWEEWTSNPGEAGGKRTDLYSFKTYRITTLTCPVAAGRGGGSLVGMTGRMTSDWPGMTAGMNKMWETRISSNTDHAIPSLNSVCIKTDPTDGSTFHYDPILICWTGGRYGNYNTEDLITSLDMGRTWSTWFYGYDAGNYPVSKGPPITMGGSVNQLQRHYAPVALKANSSDSKPQTYYFRPVCSDGTNFYIATGYKHSLRPKLLIFSGGLVLGDPFSHPSVFVAEEYE